MNNGYEEFKKYIGSTCIGWIVLAVVLVAIYLAALISCLNRGEKPPAFQLILLAAAGASLIPYWRSRQFFKKLEEEGVKEMVVQDFKGAYSLQNDQVRFGEKWFFTRHSDRIVRYDEIKQVYQHIHKTNFVEDRRSLMYVDNNGKTRDLCKLKLGGKSDNEVNTMISIIYQKNPTIKIGYR